MPPIRIILAVSEDGFIADSGGEIPWHLPFDLKWFKMNTVGSTVGMGRITWDSLVKPLSNRHHLILSTRNLNLDWDDDVEQCYSISKFKKRLEETNGWLIGGANVCKQFFFKDNIIVLTNVHTTINFGTHIELPPMKTLWKSKKIKENGYKFTLSINKII